MGPSWLCVPAGLILLASTERGFAQSDKLQSKHPVTDKSIWAKHMPLHLGLCLIQSRRLSFTAPYTHESSIITPTDMWSDNESLVERTDNIQPNKSAEDWEAPGTPGPIFGWNRRMFYQPCKKLQAKMMQIIMHCVFNKTRRVFQVVYARVIWIQIMINVSITI